MKITLQTLTLLNFKGVRSLTINFGQVNNIRGANGTGKTTVFDAFLWLLFGKDSSDRTTFEIKTLDAKNEPYHELEHEVCAVLMIDGQQVTLRKTFTEKWVKKAGSAQKTFQGHTTVYSWNDVPMTERDYNGKIASMINESQFKLLTNLAYFNTVMKWQDRRAALLQLAGGITDLDLAYELNDDRYDHLIKALTDKKTVEEYRKELVAKKNKIKQESAAIPDRIDEARRNLPEEFDYDGIEKQIDSLYNELQTVEEFLSNKSAVERERQNQITGLIREKSTLEQQLITLTNTIRNRVRDRKVERENNIALLKRQRRDLESERNRLLEDYHAEVKRKDQLVTAKNNLRKDYDRVNGETFQWNPESCVCPTCKQSLPNVDAQAKEAELRSNFNSDKSFRLAVITERGTKLGNDIAAIDAKLSNIVADGEAKKATIANLNEKIAAFEEENTRLSASEDHEVNAELSVNDEVQSLNTSIRLLQEQIDAPSQTESNYELLERKRTINSELDSLKKQLSSKDQRVKLLARISELEQQESESAQAIADIEGKEFTLLEFDKAKMDMLEQRINGMFRLVKFKLFDRQVNGGETPACVALIKGVPYTDANTASRINASLDIINVFSQHYGVQAPVFIDNRESVTDIIPTDQQIINLIVTPGREIEVEVISESQKEFA